MRRRYWIALVLASVVGLAGLLDSSGNGASAGSSGPPIQATPAQLAAETVAARAAANRMMLPRDFTHVRSEFVGEPCPGGRCYIVSVPTTTVAALVPKLIHRARFKPQYRFCTTLHPRGHGTAANCRFQARMSRKIDIVLLVEPYIACSTVKHCRWTNESAFLIDAFTR